MTVLPAGALRLPTHAHALEWLAELELRLRTLERGMGGRDPRPPAARAGRD